MSVDVLLASLRKVRQGSPGKWMACCPAHEDRTPSLSIRECEDGRVLIHCFAGCEPEAILCAVGMSFPDIMPNKIGSGYSYQPVRNRVSASDALAAMDHEALVVAIIAKDLFDTRDIDSVTIDRLVVAVGRINSACAVANNARR